MRRQRPSTRSVAVYADVVYGPGAGRCPHASVDETFALFAARLHELGLRVVLLGRFDGGGKPRANRLPTAVELVALPSYGSLLDLRAASATTMRAVRRFWVVLHDVDSVWLIGPHPLAAVFAVMALLARRRVVLGVREDLPEYVRRRHPGNRPVLAAAVLLQGAWQVLGLWCVVVVVGDDLVHRYRWSRSVVPLTVSLVEEADLVTDDDVVERARDDSGDRDGGQDVASTVLSVGRLDEEKNPLLLADVLQELRRRGRRNWRLVVCGDGSERGALESRLEALGLAGHASLVGVMPYEELRDRYRSSDVLLHVSWTEGVPQVLLEAFAAGLPVVATDVGGIAGLAGGAALLVPPGDAAAAASAVERVVRDTPLRRRLALAGRDIARGHTGATERRLVAHALGVDTDAVTITQRASGDGAPS